MDAQWASLVFGLPTVALGVVLALVALFRRAWWLFVVGLLLVAPYSIYVGFLPRFLGVPLLGFASLAGAPFALVEQRKGLAWVMVAAYVAAMLWPILAIGA